MNHNQKNWVFVTKSESRKETYSESGIRVLPLSVDSNNWSYIERSPWSKNGKYSCVHSVKAEPSLKGF